jgi:polyferredoxin
MPAFQIIFAVTATLTVLSGAAATLIVTFGDTRRNVGQRIVAERLAQIALLGAAAIASLLTLQ